MGSTTIPIVPMNRKARLRHRRLSRRLGPHWTIVGAWTPSPSEHDWQEFESSLQQLETAVHDLRHRVDQARTLQAHQQQLEQQLQAPGLSSHELQALKRQLDELEVQLESSFFDWRSLQEPFWQAVRFGGFGIVIGWILKGIASR